MNSILIGGLIYFAFKVIGYIIIKLVSYYAPEVMIDAYQDTIYKYEMEIYKLKNRQ